MSIARRFVVPAALGLVLGTLSVNPAPALAGAPPGWTQSMYSPSHPGFNPRETTLTRTNVSSLGTRWTTSLGAANSIVGSAVAGGRVYVQTVYGGLAALHASTGAGIWSVTVGDYAAASSPALWNDYVIVAVQGSDDHGVAAAFDRRSGKSVWRTVLSGPAGLGTAVVSGDSVFVTTGPDVYRLSARTGAPVWKRTISEAPYDSGIEGSVAVSVDGSHVIAATIDGRVFDLSAATGAIRWQTVAGGGIYRAGPAIAGDVIYVPEGATGAEGGGVDIVALRLRDGSQIWRGFAGDDVHVTPAVAYGLVYIGAIDTGVRALDATTGVERWAIESLPEIWSSAAVANGVVYQATESTFLAIDARTGEELFSTTIGGGFANMSSSAVWGGRVYTGSGEGIVRVFAPR